VGQTTQPVRVLQSFPHRIGAARICTTAWYQAAGASAAGAQVLVRPGAVHRPLPEPIDVRPTLARGRFRIPYKALGRTRALALHDRIVARSLPGLAGQIDVVHVWPQGALETLRVARRLGIPTLMERPNAHTRFAYEVVRDECERLGVPLPEGHEHAYDPEVLRVEEEEFDLADRLLCPSDFVMRTFLDAGFAPERLVRHQYGYDPQRFRPPADRPQGLPLTALFVGVAAVRKGAHFALEAWLQSSASQNGKLLIAGEFLPDYHAKLAPMLEHPSVEVLGHRSDVPELMQRADVLVLPSIEEGSALVTSEAMGSDCVPLVSDASGAPCVHGESGLVHAAADVATLARHFTEVSEDRALLERLRAGCRAAAPGLTWDAAGARLRAVYEASATRWAEPLAA
jgi:glycosyltransferase involved in cell wall biosynthesis